MFCEQVGLGTRLQAMLVCRLVPRPFPRFLNILDWFVTEILVCQKFWSGGPEFLENWSAGPLFSENFGPRVELWSERKYFSVSTFNDARLCQSVCIVSRIPRK